VKEDITDKTEDKFWNTVEEFDNGRLDSAYAKKRKGKEENSLPPSKLNKVSEKASSSSSNQDKEDNEHKKFLKDLAGYEETSSEEADGDSDEDEDETSSGDEVHDDQSSEGDSEDEEDQGTISQIFQEIRNGSYDSNRRMKRFEGQGQPRNERRIMTSASYQKEEDGEDVATRGDCIMSTTEALQRLTRNERDEVNEDDEWLIVKVPKKQRLKYFMIDYWDGDLEDEFHWLEGPYHQDDWTIRDLMAQKLFPRDRTLRRRQGRTEFRDDRLLDQQDLKGHPLPAFYPDCNKCLCRRYCSIPKQPDIPHLRAEQQQVRELDAKPKGDLKNTKQRSPLSPKRDGDLMYRREDEEHKDDQEEDGNTSLMAQDIDKEEEEAPLHDLMYVGIDTCSARSISYQKEDFLDLKLIDEEERDDQLRGVGGNKGVAGKGCLVFYAKDIDGNIKAIIEPKEFYLENSPAKFRILGQ
jgi:hypothetical protein